MAEEDKKKSVMDMLDAASTQSPDITGATENTAESMPDSTSEPAPESTPEQTSEKADAGGLLDAGMTGDDTSEEGTPDADTNSSLDVNPTDKSDKEKSEEPDEENAPIKDWSKVQLNFPEGLEIDQNLLKDFGKAAVECGLSRKQAQKLVDWNQGLLDQSRQEQMERGVDDLKKTWGDHMNTNLKTTMGFVSRMDRKMDGEFSKALKESGASMHPGMVKALFRLAQVTSEDSFGGGKSGAASNNSKISIAEMLDNAWKRQQAGR